MHYYTFHPKDYISKTHFLEPMEDLAYRRMLDYIYLNECHLPNDIDEIAKRINMRTHTDSIASVLSEFFDLTDKGYMNDRAEQEIAKYQNKSEKARKSANARWKNKEKDTDAHKAQSESNANALQSQSESNANQERGTNNHKPSTMNEQPADSSVVFEEMYNNLKTQLQASGIIPVGRKVNDDLLKPDIYSYLSWCDGKKMTDSEKVKSVVGFFKKKDAEDRKRYYTFAGESGRTYHTGNDKPKQPKVSDERAAEIRAQFMGGLGL